MRPQFVPSEWREVEDFPRYEINPLGLVRIKKSHNLMATQYSRVEIIFLTRDGKRYCRSVEALRKRAFE